MENSLKDYIIETYRKRAANYDFTANLYYLFGYREWAYRRMAVEALKLKPGDRLLSANTVEKLDSLRTGLKDSRNFVRKVA